MATLCNVYPWENERDRAEAMEMAVLHDVAEAIVGDITPSDGISKEEKHQREKLAFVFYDSLLKDDGQPELAGRIYEVWQKYERHESDISKVVHQIDKLDPLMQAFEYTRKYPHLGARLRDFRAAEVREQITDPFLSRIMEKTLRDWEALEKPCPHRFILVVGGPGVGKGTQCIKAARKPGIAHVSVGELLRQQENDPQSAFGDFITQSIAAKVPVPSTLAIMLLNRELSRVHGKRVILLDGFPRSEEQLSAFEREITKEYSAIIMHCTNENLIQRLTTRAVSSGRADDESAQHEDRIRKSAKSDAPVWDRLSRRPTTYQIDCNGSESDVEALFQQHVNQILSN
ncbi:hypothetical protein NKR19_g9193 [Coniochaeta hoffmannii]|uniref:HD domain-containing protein n=1 Tax=Coniochaeta hoffmannii TaxID=91930 RepID=A0AA38R498_9PEZI|nr:hypothetical protein NKR19_g9193 [Coniochaeta hoffmannii]